MLLYLLEAFKCNTGHSQTCFRSRKQNFMVYSIKCCSKLTEKRKENPCHSLPADHFSFSSCQEGFQSKLEIFFTSFVPIEQQQSSNISCIRTSIKIRKFEINFCYKKTPISQPCELKKRVVDFICVVVVVFFSFQETANCSNLKVQFQLQHL